MSLIDEQGARVFPDNDPTMQKILSIIRSYMHENELSMEEFAEKLGWKESQVASLLDGTLTLRIKTLMHIAKTMGYQLSITFENR